MRRFGHVLLYVALLPCAAFGQDHPSQTQSAAHTATAPSTTTQPVAETNSSGVGLRLRGDRVEGVVHLAWSILRWEDGLVGFDVYRRVDEKQAWAKLTKNPIIPHVADAKSIEELESDPQERKRLVVALEKDRGSEELIEAAKAMKYGLKNVSESDFVGISVMTFAAADRAIFLNVGYNDRTADKATEYDYGIFPIYSDGKAAAAPLAVFRARIFDKNVKELYATDMEVTPNASQGTNLTWRISEAALSEWSISGFFVYRAPKGSDKFEKIVPYAIGSANTENGIRKFVFFDANADSKNSYQYAVAPCNFFKRALPSRVTKAYEPPPPPVAPFGATGIAASRDPQRDMKMVISWQFDKEQASLVKGFEIERSPAPGKPFEKISDMLPDTAREFPYQESVEEGAVSYRVIAINTKNERFKSNDLTTLLFKLPIPPEPKGLSAKFDKQGDKRTVLLKWNTAAKDDSTTVGYQLYTDETKEGDVVRQASVDPIKANEYLLEINGDFDRNLTVGIAGVSEGGQEGKRIEAAVYVPGSRLNSITEIKGTLGSGENLNKPTLTWQYAKLESLAGFRVFEQGKQVADESKVGPQAREWIGSKALAKGGASTFAVAAVSKSGDISPMSAQIFILGPEIPVTKSTAITTWMKGTWSKQGDKDGILLTWEKFPENAKITRYYLSTDEKTLGVQEKAVEITPTGANEFFFPATTMSRTFNFALFVDTADQKSLEAAKAQVVSPERKLPPIALRPLSELAKGEDQVFLSWIYLTNSDIKGFRIYCDGVQICSEEDLRASARKWTTPTLSLGKHSFEVEAVAEDGSVSERGPAQKVTVKK